MRRQFANVYDEYEFLRLKVAKLKVKWDSVGIVQQKRLMRKARQLIKRMLEISEFLKMNGYEDPEVLEARRNQPRKFDTKSLPLTPHVYRPDGSLLDSMQEKIKNLKSDQGQPLE